MIVRAIVRGILMPKVPANFFNLEDEPILSIFPDIGETESPGGGIRWLLEKSTNEKSKTSSSSFM